MNSAAFSRRMPVSCLSRLPRRRAPLLFTLLFNLLFVSAWPANARADKPPAATEERLVLDRAVVRFSVPEGGGRERPYFIYERELAFEARLVALADPSYRSRTDPFGRHHLQQALERHVAETLLSALTIDPAPSPTEVASQLANARRMVAAEVGGESRLLAAAAAEGIDSLEVRSYFRRRALASLYLHVMVAPMLTPSPLELRRVHRAGEGPMADRPFDEAELPLRRWYIARSLKAAVATYFQNARARVRLAYL